jgi:hypothetical protein
MVVPNVRHKGLEEKARVKLDVPIGKDAIRLALKK